MGRIKLLTLEKCLEDAAKHDTASEWKKNSLSFYKASLRNGWYKECTAHMKNKWTLEKCLEDAAKYEKPNDWKKFSFNFYRASLRNGWHDKCTKHMKNKWTLEKCLEDAAKYEAVNKWRKFSSTAYRTSLKNGWYPEIFKKIFESKTKIKPHGYWNLERCKEEALKHKNKRQWRNADGSSYGAALKQGWMNECCAHMTKLQKQEPSGFWTKEKVMVEAKKHNRPSDWYKNSSGSVSAARKNGWYKECTAHMTFRKTKPDKYWLVKENCMEDAKKNTSKIEWAKSNSTAVNTAKKMGWYDECAIPFYSHDEAKIVEILCTLSEEVKFYANEKEWFQKNIKTYKLAKKLDLYDVLINNANFNSDKIIIEFNEFKFKLLQLMEFEKITKSKAKNVFKKDMKDKLNNLILLCNNLIKYSYE